MKNLRMLLVLIFLNILILSYGEKWVGKAATYEKRSNYKTASGDVFSKETLTAACNGFRLGAEVIITNTASKKSIKVIINDRIDENSDYFILLTPYAAQQLEMEWETNIVVIDADFSDVNSIEKLDINGLISETEIDLENLKRFPDIDYRPDVTDDKTNINIAKIDSPELEKEEIIPIKKQNKIVMDYDKVKEIDTKEIETDYPEKEILKDPRLLTYNEKLDKDLDSKMKSTVTEDHQEETKIKPEQEKEVIPKNKKEKIAMDYDKVLTMKLQEKTTDKTTEDRKINWLRKLPEDKYFIRLSTTFNEEEGKRRYLLFEEIFIDIVGIHTGKKFILFIGPLKRNELDEKLHYIRLMGFKDAYIVKE